MHPRRAARALAAALGSAALAAAAAPLPPIVDDDLRAAGVSILKDGQIDPGARVHPVAGIGAFAPPAGFGWEDSAFITGDGRTLLFAYATIRSKQLIEDTAFCIERCLRDCALADGGLPDGLAACGPICSDATDPANPGNPCTDFLAGPTRPGQQGAQFDLYEARLGRGAWTSVANLGAGFSTGYAEAAGSAIAGRWLVLTRFREEELATKVWGGDLLFSGWDADAGAWSTPVVAPRGDHRDDPTVINSLCREDNAHIIPRAGGGLIAYWESDRNPAAVTGRRGEPPCLELPRFWVAELTDENASAAASWTTPVPVQIDGIDRLRVSTQLFVRADGSEALFSGAFDSEITACADRACIYRTSRAPGATRPEGPFVGRTVLARAARMSSAGAGDVLTLGDPSLTEDGQLLYFTYARRCGDDRADPPIPCGGGPEQWDLSVGVACIGDDSDGDGVDAPCDRTVFADDLESGATGRWSTTVGLE